MQIPAGTVPMGKQSKPGRSSGPMVMSASHDPARRASRPASPVPMDVSVRACRCLSKNAAMFARAFALLQNAGATRNSRSLTGFSSQDSLISSSSRNDESTSVAFFRNALPRGVSTMLDGCDRTSSLRIRIRGLPSTSTLPARKCRARERPRTGCRDSRR